MSAIWEVVGGADKGGIIVRVGKDLKSEATQERLSTGARIKELTLDGSRLEYELIEGTGPQTGWVSLTLKDKVLVSKTGDQAEGGAAPAAAAAEAPAAADGVDAALRRRIETSARTAGAQIDTWCMKYKMLGGPLPKDKLKYRIFCFHNAGSTESAFTQPMKNPVFSWVKESKEVELVAMSYPGRDKMNKDKPHERVDTLIDAMMPVLFSKIADGIPYVVWAHSVGTWVAYEFLHLARKIGLPMPQAAIFNAFPGPHLPVDARPWHVNRNLSNDQMKQELLDWDKGHFGGRGKVVYDEPDWSDTWLPMMRADFRLFDEYTYSHADDPKFDFPIHSFFMEQEFYLRPEMIQLWSEQTTGEHTFEVIPGMGHLTCFYLPDMKKAYFDKVLPFLQRYMPA